jgi:2-polyprenyl-6-methoxyphenol hydroxylase-like FAD-dependent oxidoreductase
MSLEIVIVGGGPIGCWTALQARKHTPNLNIVVYERFKSYRRDHAMTIRRRSIAHCQSQGEAQEDLYGDYSACSRHAASFAGRPGPKNFKRN